MRWFLPLGLCLVGSLAVSGQHSPETSPSLAGLPKDPREVFVAATPFYDFSDPSLKPWHLKATYQLYDDEGQPAQQGTFEYWWASPSVYRTTWTRGDSVETEWHVEDKKRAVKMSGARFSYFEQKLKDALISPLPTASELDPSKYWLNRQTLSLAGSKFSCIMVEPIMAHPGSIADAPLGLFPTYCFDTDAPVLRIRYSMGGVVEEFNRIGKTQNKYLAQNVEFVEGKKKLLSAKVDLVSGLSASDTALTPPVGSVREDKQVEVPEGIANGRLLKKVFPEYPKDARQARIAGKVILHATIGADGVVHDLRVLSAPWPSMAESALWAVSHWQYAPYELNGEPVDINTTVTVIFSLDH
jgi:TonB family protein